MPNEIMRLSGIIGEMRNEVRELKDKNETNWKRLKECVDELRCDLHGQGKESEAMEMEHLRSQLQQLPTLINNNNSQFEQMIKQLSSVEAQLKSVMDQGENETQSMIYKYEINLHGKRVMTAEKQMPQDELRAMTEVYQWDIRDIKRTRGCFNDTIESKEFQLIGYNYGAKFGIKFESGYTHMYLKLIDRDKTKRPINTKSMPKFIYVIKDISNSPHNRDSISKMVFSFNASLESDENKFHLLSTNRPKLSRPPYLMSNGMKLKFYIEPPSMARRYFSNDGILLWTLDNYSRRKQMEAGWLTDWQESPYFYTSPQGYRVLIRLHLSSTNIYGRLCFLKGEFDSSLTPQFPHRFTMTIFNHADQSKNLVLSREGSEAAYTQLNLDIATATSLESGGYVKDDTLLIEAVVESL